MDKEYKLTKEKVEALGFDTNQEQIKEITEFLKGIQYAKGGGEYRFYLDAFFKNKVYQNEQERYCPIMEKKISGMECYETVMGCLDTEIQKHSKLSCEQMHLRCGKCIYSDIS